MKERWDRFFFGQRNLEPFAILRIGIGLAAFFEYLAFLPYLTLYFSGDGFLPLSLLPQLGQGPGPCYLLSLSDSKEWTIACYLALLATSLAYACGFRTRWTGPLLWLLEISFVNRNVYVMAGPAVLDIQLLLIVLWLDVGKALSPFAPAGGKAMAPNWVAYLIAGQMGVLYFKSGFYKAMGLAWTNGDAIKYMLANPHWRRWDFDELLLQSWFLLVCQLVTHLTAYWEILFPVTLLHRKTRNISLAIGATLHVGQFLTVSTGAFPLLLLSVYPCLLAPRDYCRLRDALLRRLSRQRSLPE